MKELANAIKRVLPSGGDKEIELRLFEIAVFMTVCILIYWSIYGLVFGYGIFIQSVYFIALASYGTIYTALKKGASFRLMSLIYYYFGLLLMCGSWLPSGGISGAITTFLVLFYISGLLVLSIKDYLLYMISTLVVVILFAIIEYQNPELAPPYATREFEVQDLAVVNVMAIIVIGLALVIFKKSYLRDRKKLNDQNKELELQKQKAQHFSRLQSEFLANMSHEIRTPLHGVVGMTELLSSTELNEQQRQYLETVEISGKRLFSLVNKVLDLSKMDAQKLSIENKEFKINQCLDNVTRSLMPLIANKSVRFVADYDIPDPLFIKGDQNRLEQVLSNLLSNAFKFTNKGIVTLSLKSKKVSEETIRINFQVLDTGIGIGPDQSQKLFSRFYQAESSSARKYEGSGLGLVISQSLVQLMGGTISFDSAIGKGTVFSFELNFERTTPTVLQNEAEKEQNPEKAKELSVLVAEDNMVNQIYLTTLLENMGHDVDVAENGEIALRRISDKHYDLIFMDIQMPEKDGIDTTIEVRKSNKDIIIIALTANAMEEDRQSCLDAGMNDYLSKPVSKEEIEKTMIKWI